MIIINIIKIIVPPIPTDTPIIIILEDEHVLDGISNKAYNSLSVCCAVTVTFFAF